MLTTLLHRELLNNLINFRFASTVLILFVLIVPTTFVLLKDYEQRLANYNTAVNTHRQDLREIKTYSAAQLQVYRPPSPLSLFNCGLDKRLGNTVWVYHGFIPTLWDAKNHESNSLFLSLFSAIDIVFIFEVVLSLMALIFAYDAIAGERERGTLRLVLAQSVSRVHILLAKYISAMVCLFISLLLSLLFAILLLIMAPALSLNTDEFLRVGGIVLTSLAYLSVFYFIGLLISAAVRRTKTALMLSMFVWAFLVLIYPNLILAEVVPGREMHARRDSAFNHIQQLWDEVERQHKKYLANDEIEGEDPNFGVRYLQGSRSNPKTRVLRSTLQSYHIHRNHWLVLHEKSLPLVPHVQSYYSFLEPLTIRTASRVWLVRKQALEDIFLQPATTHQTILKLFPSGQYDAATQALAGTNLAGIQDFFGAVRRYREIVIDDFYAKDAFASPQWFTAAQGAVDWNTLPQFSYQIPEVWTYLKRALPDIVFLKATSIILFMISYLIFIKSDV